MSGFSFNFGNDDDTHDPIAVDASANSDPDSACLDVKCPDSWKATKVDLIPWTSVLKVPLAGYPVWKRLDPQSEVFSSSSLESRGVPPESDLVPGSYGGGYKVWECSLDLIEFALGDERIVSRYKNNGSRILELGCGHGLPGIAAFAGLGGESLLLTDLNLGVLEDVTWPNVLLNCTPAQQQRIRCLSGDWMELMSKLERENAETFDLILSAETLYTENNCVKMLQLLMKYLKRGGGVAILATKRYYFGVGGGTGELHRVAQAHFHGLFDITTATEFVDGTSNIRDILAVVLK
jgi:hypothetical protein